MEPPASGSLREGRRWWPAALVAAGLVSLVWARAATDHDEGPGDPAITIELGWVAAVAGSVPVLIAATAAAWRIRRSPLPSAMALLGATAWVVVVWSGKPHPRIIPFDPLRGRDLVAYEQEARAALRHPPNAPPLTHDVAFPAGFGAVAWVEADGIPFKSAGLVWDPDRAMASGHSLQIEGSAYTVEAPSCDHLRGPWYWCRLY